MAPEKDEGFPEAEAWMAGVPKVRKDFANVSALRKTTGSEAGTDREYVIFAGLDFSNMGG